MTLNTASNVASVETVTTTSAVADFWADGITTNTPDPLQQARAAAQAAGLPYAGSVSPVLAWQLVQAGQATLVDVRTAEEIQFVGKTPAALHVAWATGTALTRNPRFVKELDTKIKDKDTVLLLLCRSGKRSALAAEAATKAGFRQVFNVQEGFEGDLDEHQQRGVLGGWRHAGLPWTQD